MCEQFDEASGSIDTLVAAVAKFGKDVGVDYDGYWYVKLQDTTIDTSKASRQWAY